jgi:hypothetical protein
MGTLPNGDRAFVDPAKVAGYLLNPHHRLGQHKARVFAAALGLREPDAWALIAALKAAAVSGDALADGADVYGVRYVLEFELTHDGKTARVQSSWIVRTGEDFPRFVTAKVAKQERTND